jgi:hypothetical protein
LNELSPLISKFDFEQPTTSGFITAAELAQIRKRCIRISTGSKQLDACLNGYTVSILDSVAVTDIRSAASRQ